jgi:hypothetical protein
MIVLNYNPIHHVNYLFLDNIYRGEEVEVIYQMVLSNLEIIFFYQLNTINIDQDRHQLFSIMDLFNM